MDVLQIVQDKSVPGDIHPLEISGCMQSTNRAGLSLFCTLAKDQVRTYCRVCLSILLRDLMQLEGRKSCGAH